MIQGLFTSTGIANTIQAQNNEGFKIFPESFGISRIIGALDISRTGPTSGEWFVAPISSRVVVDNNSIKIICTIPPNSSLVVEDVREVCIYAKDFNNVDFLLAVGQPTEEILYDPSGTVTLELQISLADVDLTSIYIFNNTKAAELLEHTTDPNAHPEVVKVLADNGIFIEGGAYAKQRMGQPIEYPVEFDGLKSTFTHDGVVFTAKYNGTELNGLTVVFDGLKGNDEIRADFNALHYPNTIEHDGLPNGVLTVATKTLVGGAYYVDNNDIVYKDIDGVYKQALADGSDKSRMAGYAVIDKKILAGHGFAPINTGYAINTPLFLSGTFAGKVTDFNTNISIGVCLGDHIFFTGYAGDISTNVAQEFDAVVTDASGAGQFPTTQGAVNFVPNNGRILIKKLELVKQTINSTNKNLNFVFDGADTGWKRFLGQATIFTVSFSGLPTQGTWRMEWEGQESNDMPYNASAVLVQTEFNLFDGHNGFTVTGNATNGYTFTSDDLQVYSLPTFTYVGRNEIQHFSFSAVPNNGTLRFEFDGQETVNHAFNDTIQQLQDAFDVLSSTKNVIVTGSFASGYTIEFDGGWLQDGNKEQNLIQAVTNFLYVTPTPVMINGVLTIPVSAQVLQKGKKPASNLYDGTNLLSISTHMVQLGEEVGPDRLMNVSSPIFSAIGQGIIEDFREGLVLSSANNIVQLQARPINTDKPVLASNKIPTINYDLELANYAKDVVAQLRLSEHPTNKKRVFVTGMDFQLATGITLSKTLGKLKAVFSGAEVDFSLGKIFSSDGVTDIGLDFPIPAITPTNWQWFSINLLSSVTHPVTNEIIPNILVLPAQLEGTTKELAPKAGIGKNPIGMVALKGSLGAKEKTLITTIKDAFATPLKGTCLVLDHPNGSVAFWFADPALGASKPALAYTASRDVEITTLVTNDFQATVATKLRNAINADPDFVATVVGNKITVENSILGAVSPADMGTTGFFKTTLVSGTDTDLAGIDDIFNNEIIQFSTGSGSGGGGAGDANDFTENLKHRLVESFFDYVTPCVFSVVGETLTDPATTAVFNTTDEVYVFQSGNSFVSKQLMSADFLAKNLAVKSFEVHAKWADGFDNALAVFSLSNDGGTTYTPVTMVRHGSSNLFTGRIFLSTVGTNNLRLKVTANADDKKLEAFGVFYSEYTGTNEVATTSVFQEITVVGSDNTTSFTISDFTVDGPRLKVYDLGSGQVYVPTMFTVTGQVVTFPTGFFHVLGETFKLRFEQN